MTDLNDRIRQALHADEEQTLASLADEPDIFAQVLETFHHRNRWLVIMVIVFTFAFMGLAITCVVKFFGAVEVRAMIAWAIGFATCFGAIGAMKIWYWMELQKNAITREIKRLELQVTRLAER